jgi:glycerate kinase
MRVLIAFDKFKDALSANQACAVAAKALKDMHPETELDVCPLADGGDGFQTILTQTLNGKGFEYEVKGPQGKKTKACIGIVSSENISPDSRKLLKLSSQPLHPNSHLAIVEMASASGLALLPITERNPWVASSFGTGELLALSSKYNVEAIVLGIGGSATHDLGLGALSALGINFLRSDDTRIDNPTPSQWREIKKVTGKTIKLPPLRIACDVANPLLGTRGAAHVYATQKGLPIKEIDKLEEETTEVVKKLSLTFPKMQTLLSTPGSGAAGGIAFGLMATLEAELVPGFELVTSLLDLENKIKKADVIITGEGRFDQSSYEGKGPGTVIHLATKYNKKAHVFAGEVTSTQSNTIHQITDKGTPLSEALKLTEINLRNSIIRNFT